MTDTYKLIDLFQSSECKHWFRDNADMMELANYLVENGTTVQTSALVNSIQDDFCGVPCDFMQDIIDSQAKMIKRQSAEIERLTNKCDDCAGCTQWKCDCSNIKTQAYEEFAEDLKDIYNKDKRYERPNAHTMIIKLFDNIDKLLAEKIGEING